jgi:hypothetical protein
MKVHANVTQANGVIQIQLQCTFVGAPTDANDKALIAAFGDPEINIAGSFTDPNNPAFTFQFPSTQIMAGITTTLSSYTAQFMLALPGPQNPNQPAPVQGPLDCVTQNPSEAATAWVTLMQQSIRQAMLQLRSMMLMPVIPDITV